jgi:hypothetical protein
MQPLDLHSIPIDAVHDTFVDQHGVKTAEDGQLGLCDRSGRLEENLRSAAMSGVAEDRVSGPVEVPIHWRGIKAAQEPEEAIRTGGVHSLQDGARTENQKNASNFRQRIALRGKVWLVSGFVKAIRQNLGSVHVHRSKRGEPNLSGEVVGAERVSKEARTRFVEKDRGGECPAVIGTRVEGIVRDLVFQSVLRDSH